jgi:hypothetical protein
LSPANSAAVQRPARILFCAEELQSSRRPRAQTKPRKRPQGTEGTGLEFSAKCSRSNVASAANSTISHRESLTLPPELRAASTEVKAPVQGVCKGELAAGRWAFARAPAGRQWRKRRRSKSRRLVPFQLIEQIPSRMLFPCLRPILGRSFGPNSWNGTRWAISNLPRRQTVAAR